MSALILASKDNYPTIRIKFGIVLSAALLFSLFFGLAFPQKASAGSSVNVMSSRLEVLNLRLKEVKITPAPVAPEDPKAIPGLEKDSAEISVPFSDKLKAFFSFSEEDGEFGSIRDDDQQYKACVGINIAL